MKMPFNFTAKAPPVLTEGRLRELIYKRRLKRQLLLLTLAAALCGLCLLLLAALLQPVYPVLSALCWGYLSLSIFGGAAIALILARKRSVLRI